MRDSRLSCVLVVTALLLGGCNSTASPSLVESAIRIGADTACWQVTEGLLNAYEVHRPDAILTLLRGNRDTALAALAAGEIDAAVLLHPPESNDLFYTPIAREWLIIVVHPDLPISNLSRSSVRALFTGWTATWESLGGPSLPVQVIARETGSSERLAFDYLVMDGAALTSSARLAVGQEQIIDLVAQTPGSIGYVTHSVLDERVTPLAFEGVPPTRRAAGSSMYLLITEVVLVAAREPEGNLRAFLEWVLGESGQAVIRRYMLGLNDRG